MLVKNLIKWRHINIIISLFFLFTISEHIIFHIIADRCYFLDEKIKTYNCLADNEKAFIPNNVNMIYYASYAEGMQTGGNLYKCIYKENELNEIVYFIERKLGFKESEILNKDAILRFRNEHINDVPWWLRDDDVTMYSGYCYDKQIKVDRFMFVFLDKKHNVIYIEQLF